MRILGILFGLILWLGASIALLLHSYSHPKWFDFFGVPSFLWHADGSLLQPWWPLPLLLWQALSFSSAGALLVLTYTLFHEGTPMRLRRAGRFAAFFLLGVSSFFIFYFFSALLRLDLSERFLVTAYFYLALGGALFLLSLAALRALRGNIASTSHSFFSFASARELIAGASGFLFLTVAGTIVYLHAVSGSLVFLRFPGILFGEDALLLKPWELFFYDVILTAGLIALAGTSFALFLIRRLPWRIAGIPFAVTGLCVSFLTTGALLVLPEQFPLFSQQFAIFGGLFLLTGMLHGIALFFFISFQASFRFKKR